MQVRSFTIPTGEAAAEKGRHLVTTRGCVDCHGPDLGGRKVIDDPAMGVFWAPNLTRGAGGLSAAVTDVDLIRAIRHGVSRDNRALVLMPSEDYAGLSDEDLGSMLAYIKTQPAIDRPSGPVAPGPVARVLILLGQIKLAAEHIDQQAVQVATITPEISPAYGKYLSANCIGCHGPSFSGGKIPGGPPAWPAAANLTPDPSAPISHWSETQFVDLLRTRKRPDGSTLDPVMPAAYAQMTDVELKALWAYLKTVPARPTGNR